MLFLSHDYLAVETGDLEPDYKFCIDFIWVVKFT
jgi:hypothetical protein